MPSDILLAYERGRVAERLAEREDAAEAWRHGDAVLQPMVAESRRALQRL